MKKVDAYQILKDEGHLNILEIVKGKGYFLDNHSHDFDVDLIIISGTLEIITNNSSVILSPGSRYKMKKIQCILKIRWRMFFECSHKMINFIDHVVLTSKI